MGTFPEQGIHGHIFQHVVHPAHVPFIIEAQAALVRRSGDHGPGGGFFRDHQGLGNIFKYRSIELAQKIHGFQVFPAAVLVGLPLSLLFPVIQIQHVGHGINPQPVQMELLQPEAGTGNQEALHFRAAVIKIHGIPVFVFRQHDISGFIQRFPVKMPQAVGILAEMSRHPVQDHADFVFVQRVHQVHEIFRASVTAGSSEIPCGLVAPGTVVRIFAQGHQFHMSIAHLFYILRQRFRNVPVGHHLTFRVPFPGTQMDLVDEHGIMIGVVILPAFLPAGIMPLVMQVLYN